MPKAVSIHVGINFVDKKHYGLQFALPWCENDAAEMMNIVEQNGFDVHVLLNEDATSANFFCFLNKASSYLVNGDILFISFSGHGTNFRDLNGDEDDGWDEALVFYDRVVIDDELHLMWTQFSKGVRILFISDSCHSGTVTKDVRSVFGRLFKSTVSEDSEIPFLYERNKFFYEARFKNIPARIKTPIRCSVLLISACQDDELAGAGSHSSSKLSTFTEALRTCWDSGNFEGNYRNFYNEIKAELINMRSTQNPNYYFIGEKNSFFEGQIPFAI